LDGGEIDLGSCEIDLGGGEIDLGGCEIDLGCGEIDFGTNDHENKESACISIVPIHSRHPRASCNLYRPYFL